MLHGSSDVLPRLTPQEGSEYRLANGYTCEQTEWFACDCEVISLGCYCAVSEALNLLGIRQRAYPFDWVRSPMDGIVRCFETDFEDFLTYSSSFEKNGCTVFAGARWGGSFWHHDIQDESVQHIFSRRVKRLTGFSEVASCKPRVFVRLLNSSQELDLAVKLKEVLRRAFPEAHVYLLLIVDLQEIDAPMSLEGFDGDGLIIYFMNAAGVYASIGMQSRFDFEARSKAYATSIAFSIRLWAGGEAECASLRTFPNLAAITASCKQWFGGDPSIDLYGPQYFKGQPLLMKCTGLCTLPKLFCEPFHPRSAEFILPDGVVAGDLIRVEVFDDWITLRVPEPACAGALIQCSMVEGVFKAFVVTDASDCDST